MMALVIAGANLTVPVYRDIFGDIFCLGTAPPKIGYCFWKPGTSSHLTLYKTLESCIVCVYQWHNKTVRITLVIAVAIILLISDMVTLI